MKKLLLLLMMCSFFAATNVFGQQWNGSGSISGNLYRNGNVGIGESSPSTLLHIKSVSQATLGGGFFNPPNIRLELQSNSEFNDFWDITSGVSLDFASGTSIANMTSRMSLGATVLAYKGNTLSIGLNEYQSTLGSQNAPSGSLGQYLAFGANALSGGWQFTGNSTNNGGAIIQGDDKGNLFFITRATAASNTMTPTQTANNVRLFVSGDGKVGIGTSTPTAKLHVADGNLFVSNGNLSIATGNATIYGGDLTIANGKIVLVDGLNNELALYNDGRIHAREIEVNLDVIPDYVFADDYELMPLAELQKFTDLNHHLPNIKSAEEYEAYGRIPLKELSLKLLEKVEELTLYTLEQEAEIEALKAANEEIEILKKQMVEMQNMLKLLTESNQK
jgi:hypothetical protein